MYYTLLPCITCQRANNEFFIYSPKPIFTHIWCLASANFGPWLRQHWEREMSWYIMLKEHATHQEVLIYSFIFFSPRHTFLFGFWGKLVYDWEEFVCFLPGQTIFNPAVDRLTQRGLNFSFPVQSFSQVIIWALNPSDYSGFFLS